MSAADLPDVSNVSLDAEASFPATGATLHGVVFDILVGSASREEGGPFWARASVGGRAGKVPQPDCRYALPEARSGAGRSIKITP